MLFYDRDAVESRCILILLTSDIVLFLLASGIAL